MLSIITAVHNGLEYNKLYLESIQKYTYYPYEIIIVDNHSTDGSAEFFEEQGCKVIRNEHNLCYPKSQNLGMKEAKYPYLCFLNNDVYLGINWDKHLLEAMDLYHLEAVSPCGIENMESQGETRRFGRRWKKIGYYRGRRLNIEGLRRLLFRMYGDWEKFCQERQVRLYPTLAEGIMGSCIVTKRELLEKIGPWDERIMSGDWDFYLRLRKREEEIGDVHRVMTVCWAYVHHFIRATLKSHPEPYRCDHAHISLQEKWGLSEIRRLWPHPLKGSWLNRWFGFVGGQKWQ